MIKRIYIKGNYIVIQDNTNLNIDNHYSIADTDVEINGSNYSFRSISKNIVVESIKYSNVRNFKGLNYTSESDFKKLIRNNTIFKSKLNIANLPLTAFGDLRTAELAPQLQQSFEYTVNNTDLTINSIANGGTVTQSSGMCVLTSSTTTASSAKLISKQHAKYRSGLGGLTRFTALFTTGVADTEQYIGIMDEEGSSAAFKNGYAIGFNGGDFSILRFQNDVLFDVVQSDWDDPLDGTGESEIIFDPTKLNVFQISYQYLGAGAINFFIEDPKTGIFKLFHTIKYSNNNILPSTFNPNYHFTLWVNNKATTDNLIMKSSSYAYFMEGSTSFIELHQPQNSTGIKSKASITTEVAIFTIRNKTSFVSKTNFIDIFLENVTSSIEANSANNLGSVRLVKNATLGGTLVWNDINTTNSVVEIDVAGTTVTNGTPIFPAPLAGKNDKILENLTSYKIILNPGETMTLAGLSANEATMQGSLLWKELF